MKQKPQVLIMVRIALIFIIYSVLIDGCTLKEYSKTAEESGKDLKAQEIVDNAIAMHGGERFINSKISFFFRDQHFFVQQNKTSFKYVREAMQDSDSVKDFYRNGIFHREINGNLVTMSDDDEAMRLVISTQYPTLLCCPINLMTQP